jgi:predicted nucleotidyltransferase
LETLKNKKLINYEAGFYFLGTDPSKVKQRLEDNHLANKRMNTAKKYARFISNFPYVRAVLISGSLSKNVMKPDSDIDYFIITKPGRLWVCRAILTFFKKIFLGNSYRNFCLNYFIDTDSLEIPDKNIFTATEIVFILPMYNYELYQQFMAANRWCHNEFPNLENHPENVKIKPSRKIKSIFETLLNNGFGDWLDEKCFSVISQYWRKKFSHFDENRFSLNLRSQKNVSKHHPNGYQESVLKKYEEKIHTFEQSTGFRLSNAVKKATATS